MNYKIGIDYGGTKIEGILINDKGEEILRKRSGYEKNYESGVNTIKNLVEEFDKHTLIQKIQLGSGYLGLPLKKMV